MKLNMEDQDAEEFDAFVEEYWGSKAVYRPEEELAGIKAKAK